MTYPFDPRGQSGVPAPGSQSPALRAAALAQSAQGPDPLAPDPNNPNYLADQQLREQMGVGPNDRLVKNPDGTYTVEPENADKLDFRAFQALVNATGEGNKEIDHIVVTHTYSNHTQRSPYPVGTVLTPEQLAVPPGYDARRYIAELASINCVNVFYKDAAPAEPVQAVQPTTPAAPAPVVDAPAVPTVSPGHPGEPDSPAEPQGVPEA